MTRREFSIAIAGSVASPAGLSRDTTPVVILTAIAGVRLPQTLTITGTSPDKMREGLWELRTYRAANPALANRLDRVFRRAGIRPFSVKANGPDLTYVVPFENLAARHRAWTTLNADPEWTPLRHQFLSYRFGLYRLGFDRES